MKSNEQQVRQKEFSALMQEMQAFGCRPATVARMLNKSRGAISQYLSNYTCPSETVLALLRRVVAEKRKGGDSNLGEGLQHKLAAIKCALPDGYEIVERVVEILYGRVLVNAKKTAKSSLLDSEGSKSDLAEIQRIVESTLCVHKKRNASKSSSSKKERSRLRLVRSESSPLISQ